MGDKPKTLKEAVWQWRLAATDSEELSSCSLLLVAVLSTKMEPYSAWVVDVPNLAKRSRLSSSAVKLHLKALVQAGWLRKVQKDDKPSLRHRSREYMPIIPGVPEGWDYAIHREGCSCRKCNPPAVVPGVENEVPLTNEPGEEDMHGKGANKFFLDRKGQSREMYVDTDYISMERRMRNEPHLVEPEQQERFRECQWYRGGGRYKAPAAAKKPAVPVVELNMGQVDYDVSEYWHDTVMAKFKDSYPAGTNDGGQVRGVKLIEALTGGDRVVLGAQKYSMAFFLDGFGHKKKELENMFAKIGRVVEYREGRLVIDRE